MLVCMTMRVNGGCVSACKPMPTELVATILERVPRELDPVLRLVCREWNELVLDVLTEGRDEQGKPRPTTLLDTACWGARTGDLPMLHYGGDGRHRRKLGEREGCWPWLYRAFTMTWASFRVTATSIVARGNVDSKSYEKAMTDFSRWDKKHRRPAHLEIRRAAIEGGKPAVLATLFDDGSRGLGADPPPPNFEDLKCCIDRGSAEAFELLEGWFIKARGGLLKTINDRAVACCRAVFRGRLDIVKALYAEREQEMCAVFGLVNASFWREREKHVPGAIMPHFERALLNADVPMVRWFCDRYGTKMFGNWMTAVDFLELEEAMQHRTENEPWPSCPTDGPTDASRGFATDDDGASGTRRVPQGTDEYEAWEWKDIGRQPHVALFCYSIACRRRNREALQWLWVVCNAPLSILLAKEVAATGDVEMLQWLTEHNCPFNAAATLEACKWNHLEALIWLRERGCPWHEVQCAKKAYTKGHDEMLRWIHENGEGGIAVQFRPLFPIQDRHVQLREPRKENKETQKKEDQSGVQRRR